MRARPSKTDFSSNSPSCATRLGWFQLCVLVLLHARRHKTSEHSEDQHKRMPLKINKIFTRFWSPTCASLNK